MAPRPPMQIVLEVADYDPTRRSWRQSLFTSDGTPIDLTQIGAPGTPGEKGDPGDPGAPGSTLLSGLEDVTLVGLADGDGLTYNSTTEEWENGPIAGGGSAPASIYDQVVTAQSSVSIDVSGADQDNYEFEIDGLLAQGATARYVRIKPNNEIGVNPGNLIRTMQHSAYTGADGTPGHAVGRIDEQGFVLGAMVDTRDAVILGEGKIKAKTGQRRMCVSQLDTTSNNDDEVNQMSHFITTAKMSDKTTPLTSLVFDFGGGTFTGRIIVR